MFELPENEYRIGNAGIKRLVSLTAALVFHACVVVVFFYLSSIQPKQIDLDMPMVSLEQVTIGGPKGLPEPPKTPVPPKEDPAPPPPPPADDDDDDEDSTVPDLEELKKKEEAERLEAEKKEAAKKEAEKKEAEKKEAERLEIERKEAEEKKRKAEEDEKKRKAEEEEKKRKAEEEKKRKAEDEKKRKAEEEEKKRKAAEEKKRKDAEAAEKKRKAAEEKKRKAAEAAAKAEEETLRKALEAAQQKSAETNPHGTGGGGGDGVGILGVYTDSVSSRIRPHLTTRPRSDGQVFHLTVRITIADDGTIVDAKIVEPPSGSGDKTFDANVLRAIREAGKMEPPPSPQYKQLDVPFNSNMTGGK